jgi:hypothetical protein
MGHESRIELWSPNLTTFCFVGFGTDRLRCEEAMKTAGRENPNRWTILSSNRAPGAGGQNRSCSIQWAAKQEKFRPMQECFFLTSTFIELIRTWRMLCYKKQNTHASLLKDVAFIMPEGITQKSQIDAAFIGMRCTNIVRFAAESWRFEFNGRTTLDVRCPWRTACRTLASTQSSQRTGLCGS